MIGLDFPVKPDWIHDVHRLWQPNQPVSELVQAALAQTMSELGGEKTRRNSLSIIIRCFVTIKGKAKSGRHRYTASQDVWVAFSRAYPVSTLAPAYLTRLIADNEVAQFAARFITNRHQPGEMFRRNELRRQVISYYGERKVVLNTVSAFLRTLQYFGVLAPGERLGEYRFERLLLPTKEVFPLVVWSVWCTQPNPLIDLKSFDEHPSLSFLDTSRFADYWLAYQPALWSISERLDIRQATLKATSESEWENRLLQ